MELLVMSQAPYTMFFVEYFQIHEREGKVQQFGW